MSEDECELKVECVGDSQLPPERDLSNRYQSMIDDQFQSVSNFEDKAWKAIRANIALIGIYLTGLSILSEGTNSTPSIQIIDSIPILLGIISLFASLVLAIIVQLGIEIGFGPSTDMADSVIKSELENEEYDNILVKSYSKAVDSNWEALEDKSRRLRKSFSLLIIGLIGVSLGLLFVISPNHEYACEAKTVVLILTSIASYVVGSYLWKKKYDTDNGGEEGDETGSADTEVE